MRSVDEVRREMGNISFGMSPMSGSDLGNDERSRDAIDYLERILEGMEDGSMGEPEIRAFLTSRQDTYEDGDENEDGVYIWSASDRVYDWMFPTSLNDDN
jgi:hypothetical protein